MKYPTWKEFEAKYPDYQETAFEALARMLFRCKYELGDSLPYFKNHAGNETDTVVADGVVTGFQAKYFDKEINADKIEHSIRTAHAHNPNQKKMIVYTNLEFGNPRKEGETKTEKQKNIERVASECGIELEWMYGDNILDAVVKNDLAYNVFFNPDCHLQHLVEDVAEYNDLQLAYIQTGIAVGDKEYRFDRSEIVNQLCESVAQMNNVMIAGESGCGKSAVIKEYYNLYKQNRDYVFYIINASQLNTQELNSLFDLHHVYSFSEFYSYFAEVKHKVLVIDSAEQLLDLNNRRTALMLIDKLKREDWAIVVTCKSNSQAEALELFKDDFRVDFQTISVGALADYEFEGFMKNSNIRMPLDEKLKKQIHIPFYLARYCEVGGMESNVNELREKVWNKKVRGTSALGRKMESCLFEIVRRKQSFGSFVVSTEGLEAECVESLIRADVIGERLHQGVFVKHDIYTDWALDYMLTADMCNKRNIAVKLLERPSISYVNAFRRWLTERMEMNDMVIESILNVMFSDKIDHRWVNTILEVIGASVSYAGVFVNKYNKQLCDNAYTWFNKFAETVCVSCRVVTQYIPYKDGIRIPISNSVGSGWDAAISFIDKEKDAYLNSNISVVYNILNGYTGKRKKDAGIARVAGLIALSIFDMQSAKRYDDLYFWQVNMKEWAVLVCKYSTYIQEELNNVLRKVIEHKWVEYNSPYKDLVEYLLNPTSTFVDLQVYYVCRQNLLDLMKLCWQEKKDDGAYCDHAGTSRFFGIDEYCGGGRGYFPPSPYQTPIHGMLNTESIASIEDCATLDFVIGFVDECVEVFRKRGRELQPLDSVQVVFDDGSSHDVICSSMLWNMYRGTSGLSVPYLLESIHMAVEKYLLDQLEGESKHKNTENVRGLLWRILKESHSASMYAIVASVVVAHYDVYFDLFVFLIQKMRFLQLDLHRQISEYHAMSMSFVYHRHRDYATERKKSAEKEHRKLHLEALLTNMQINYENSNAKESKERLDKLYLCVDKLKAEYKSMPKNVMSDEPYIMERIDVRKWKKTPVHLSNGIEAVSYEPVFSDDLVERRDVMESQSRDMMAGMNLMVWADKMLNGQVDNANIYTFHDNPDEILSIIKDAEASLDKTINKYGTSMNKEYIPYVGSAALLIYYNDRLAEAERDECSRRVIEALSAPDFLLSDIMSGFATVLRTIPILVDLYPDASDEIADIILIYAKRRKEIGNVRACDKVREMIVSCNMWQDKRMFMEMTVARFVDRLKLDRIEEISMDDAVTVLSLLTEKPLDRMLANLCVKKLAGHWNLDERDVMNDYYNKLADSDFVAQYLLNSPDDEIPALATIFGDCMARKQDHESLLSKLLFECISNERYDKFWTIWYALFPSLVKSAILLDSSARMEYMLCPSFQLESSNDWFKFESKDVAFFEKISENVGPDDDVLFCTLRVFNTIGSRWQVNALPIVYGQTRQPIPSWSNLKKHIMSEMDLYIDHIDNVHRYEIIEDSELYNMYCAVLDFAKENLSETAARILKTL